jgi:rhamnogalacturonyl hydrolase YesR
MRINTILSSILVLFLVMASTGYASELPTYSELQKVLKDVVKEKNGGFKHVGNDSR